MKTGFQFTVSLVMEHCLGVDRRALARALELAAAEAARQYILGTKAEVTVVEEGQAEDVGVASLEPPCPPKYFEHQLPAHLVLGPTPPDRVMWN